MMYRYYQEPPEPQVDGTLVCHNCGEIIPGGSDYFEIDGLCYCEDCIEQLRRIAPYKEEQ